ncbi:MAG: hypothetical protein O2871_00475 [bacterium]|jgi:uncharacterized membrane protein YvlD (DUF360 family)|nr:hypothetical protein [bacterium]
MIIKYLKNFAYSFTSISLLSIFFYNINITSVSNLLIFVTFLVVLELFIIPPLNLLLYPFNFLVFGRLKTLLQIIGFVLLLNVIPYATFDDFSFKETEFMGIILPQIQLNKFIFVIVFSLIYSVVKNLVFAENKEKK